MRKSLVQTSHKWSNMKRITWERKMGGRGLRIWNFYIVQGECQHTGREKWMMSFVTQGSLTDLVATFSCSATALQQQNLSIWPGLCLDWCNDYEKAGTGDSWRQKEGNMSEYKGSKPLPPMMLTAPSTSSVQLQQSRSILKTSSSRLKDQNATRKDGKVMWTNKVRTATCITWRIAAHLVLVQPQQSQTLTVWLGSVLVTAVYVPSARYSRSN